MNRRRTRYKFIAQHDKRYAGRIDVLAYSAERAFEMLERAGYYNIERYKTPPRPRPQGGGFTFDRAAIKAAQEFLGLKYPVKIRTHARVGGTQGNYRLRMRDGKLLHDVMVKDYLTPEQAGRALWHELTHAMQAERETAARPHMLPQKAWTAAYNDGVSYRHKPLEVEARDYMALNDDHPLAR